MNIDWSRHDAFPPSACYCRCGAVYPSHAKLVIADGTMVSVSRVPCPSCGQSEGHLRRISDTPERISLSQTRRYYCVFSGCGWHYDDPGPMLPSLSFWGSSEPVSVEAHLAKHIEEVEGVLASHLDEAHPGWTWDEVRRLAAAVQQTGG